MSVTITEVSKSYGDKHAVNNISFEVGKGEILGFLGPNGAGKTTTMKMITCYIAPDQGNINVCGHEVGKNKEEIARHIGYLPEHNPLYLDMYVKEYLGFVAGVHKVKDKKRVISNLIEQTGINQEANKKIKQLSKGYRQRVGLAQAMINDPEVLILDEPTSGLDPNQLIGIRSLIKELGKEKTVIFSTHIMQEVQALCDRVTIINEGNLIIDESIDKLDAHMKGEQSISIKFEKSIDLDKFTTGYDNISVSSIGKHEYQIVYTTDESINAALFDFAVQEGNRILEMKSSSLSMEEIFQKLTLQN